MQLLHELGLGADRVERLQQKSAEQTFRWNRWPSAVGVDLRELAIECYQHLVDEFSHSRCCSRLEWYSSFSEH
jgi:hypothetical protein